MSEAIQIGLPEARHITPAELPAVLAAYDRVVVDVTGEGWCPWCDMLSPIIRKHMWQYPNVHVVKIDYKHIDEMPDEYGVKGKGVPHLLAFHKGKLVEHGGFESNYFKMARWFARAAGVRNPYARRLYEKEFGAAANVACQVFTTTMESEGEPYIKANSELGEAWQKRQDAIEADHKAGKINDEERAARITANAEQYKKEREPVLAPYFELRKRAVAAYVEAIEAAAERFLVAARENPPKKSTHGCADTADSAADRPLGKGGACGLHGKGCCG